MSTRQDRAPSPPVGSREDLVAWIAAGCKPPERWRIGTEHEKFLFHVDTLKPVAYAGPRGVRALMQSLIDRFGWLPIMEGDNIIALQAAGRRGRRHRLAGTRRAVRAVRRSRCAACTRSAAETHAHLSNASRSGRRSASAFSASASAPHWTLDEMPRMPKQRYGVMTRYMPQVGSRGLDMMYRTCTIQVNLDFADEADMVKKFRVSLALQPVATAIFACSPFTERQAERVPVHAQRGVARHRQAPHGHAAVRVRARHGLRALRRLRARRADVFRLPRRPLHRCRRRVVPRFSCRQAAAAARASGPRSTTGRITSPRCFPKCA